MGKLLFMPRKPTQPKPNYLQGSLVFLGIVGFCLAFWVGAYALAHHFGIWSP